MSISLHELLAKKTGRAQPAEPPQPFTEDVDYEREPELPIEQENNYELDNSSSNIEKYEEGELMLGSETNFQYIPEDEVEMPGSSTTVGADDDEIFNLLQPSQQHRSSMGKAEKEHDIVELFSTIAFLRRENQDLLKELEFTKSSKDAIFKEAQTKADATIDSLQKQKKELQDLLSRRSQEVSELSTQSATEIDRLKSELEQMTAQKESLENNVSKTKDDQGSLRGDLLTAKSENNRLKMELGRAKGDNERLTQDIDDLKNDLQTAKAAMDQGASAKEEQIKQMQQEIKRLEEQLHFLKNDNTEKAQIIGKMNEDIVSFDRNLQHANAQNNDFKQRLSMMDIMDRDLQGIRHRMSLLEKENRDLLTEVGSLRNQLQTSTTYNSNNNNHNNIRPMPPMSSVSATMSSYSAPPPPPPVTSYQASSGHSSYSSHNTGGYSSHYTQPAEPTPPPHQATNNYRSSASSISYSQPEHVYNSSNNNTTFYNNSNSIGSNNNATAHTSTSSRQTGAKSLSSALGDVADVRRSMAGQQTHDHSPVPPTSSAASAAVRPRDSIGSVLGGNQHHAGNSNNNNSGGNSLASLLQSKKQAPTSLAATTGRRQPGDSPFATEQTAVDIMSGFEDMERELTRYMTEKTLLTDENEKLLQRGLKTLRERTRSQQVEARLDDISKQISSLRLKLLQKPG